MVNTEHLSIFADIECDDRITLKAVRRWRR